jgi:hypothetical protein
MFIAKDACVALERAGSEGRRVTALFNPATASSSNDNAFGARACRRITARATACPRTSGRSPAASASRRAGLAEPAHPMAQEFDALLPCETSISTTSSDAPTDCCGRPLRAFSKRPPTDCAQGSERRCAPRWRRPSHASRRLGAEFLRAQPALLGDVAKCSYECPYESPIGEVYSLAAGDIADRRP